MLQKTLIDMVPMRLLTCKMDHCEAGVREEVSNISYFKMDKCIQNTFAESACVYELPRQWNGKTPNTLKKCGPHHCT